MGTENGNLQLLISQARHFQEAFQSRILDGIYLHDEIDDSRGNKPGKSAKKEADASRTSRPRGRGREGSDSLQA